RVHRPDLPDLGTTVWVDCLHTDGPGLRLAGHPVEAVTQVEEVSAALQDETGLYSHGYDVASGQPNAVHWGRGQGWALLGLTGARSERLRPRVDALVTALSRCEEDGRWRTVVDAQDSPVENSVSALVALGVMSGVRAGVLDASWLAMSDRALDAAVAAIDGDGGLPVSSATPVGVPDTYAERDTGVHPWGQGPLLLALLAANGTQSR
ncbi:MAG: glycoside hydrolase family 88 protein, partial [Streptosporangiales bacterium]|nr:glycoside hydrolase family 88 protein [Streptosporangiales bacterium]